jgi:hypothetical protein
MLVDTVGGSKNGERSPSSTGNSVALLVVAVTGSELKTENADWEGSYGLQPNWGVGLRVFALDLVHLGPN